MRRSPERDLQIQVATFLRQAIKSPCQWWWVPNGNNLSRAQAGLSKAMGLTPGVPDIHFIWPGGYGVIELKAKAGRLSEEQIKFMSDAGACGHGWAVCKTIEQVEQTLIQWGVPLHARLS